LDKLEELLKNKDLLLIKYKLSKKFYGLDRDDIESAFNVSVWKASVKYNPKFEIKFTTFFYRIFCQSLINLSRKIQKNQELTDIHEIEYCEFEKKIVDLSIENRNLLVQRYLEQKTLAEIGKELGVSHEVVRKRLKNCIRKLKED
jgi:RNA polymerase sigma factor (sigma-70 family)